MSLAIDPARTADIVGDACSVRDDLAVALAGLGDGSSRPERRTGATHASVSDASAPPSASLAAVRGRLRIALPLRHAGTREVEIAYESIGPNDAPVVLAAGGISAHKHVLSTETFPEAGWWETQNGRGLDASRTRIVAIDWLGADGAIDAPIDARDQADAIAATLDALGIEAVDAYVGASYGAMVGLQFAARYPQRVRTLIVISGAHRAHPYASAWRALQRQIVGLGQLQCDDAQGLSLARQLAMLSYRTPGEFAERFDAPPSLVHGRARVAAEDYLEHCGLAYVARTSPTAFLRLSESIDLHRIDPESVRVPTVVVGVTEDRLVPVEDIFELAERLPEAELRLLRSKYGHDAFLTEIDHIAAVLVSALPQSVACTGGAA